MADQVVDPIAAKYGGAAVAEAEPQPDEVAKKYGGVIDPAARKFGGLPVDQATGRPAPVQVDRQFDTTNPEERPQDLQLSLGGQPYATGRFTPLEAETILNSPAARGTVATAAVPPHVNAPEATPELPVTDIGAPGQPMRRAPVNEGVRQAGRGAATLFDLAKQQVTGAPAPQPGQPSPGETALNAGSDILEGGFQALSPLLYASLGGAPVATGAALVGAWAGSKGASTGTTALGGTPAQARFAGNLAALVTGALAARAVSGGETGAAKTATDGEAAQVDAAARQHAASVLGVDPNADPATLQSAYRAAARANHPDVGGNVDTMADINLAYEWLTDHPAPLTARAKVTLSDWIRQQAAWLREKFPSRSAAAADRANPPAPSTGGRGLPGEVAAATSPAVDPVAEQFGGSPVEEAPRAGEQLDEGVPAPRAAAPEGVKPEEAPGVPRGIPEVDPVAEKLGGVAVAAARSPEGSGQGNLLGGAPKSVLSTLEPPYREALISALGRIQEGGSRWNELRLRGATDGQILAQAGQEFGISGGSSRGAGEEHKGGKNPSLTLGNFTDAPVKLTGLKLAHTIRELVGIPQPVQTLGGKPLAPERPIGFWEMKPEELKASVGFDVKRPGETGPNATSTPEQLDAFHDRLIDNLLTTAQTEGVAALPKARKLLGALEHLRDHSDPSDYDYRWDVEPFTRAIPEIDRIVKRLEGQWQLPGVHGGSRAVPIPEGLEETRDFADVQTWAKAEAEKTGQTVEAVLKAHELPATPEAFAKWIYPAEPGSKVPKAEAAPTKGKLIPVRAADGSVQWTTQPVTEPEGGKGEAPATSATAEEPAAIAPLKVGDRVTSWQGTGAIHGIQGTDARIYLEDKGGQLSKWMPLKDLTPAPAKAAAAAPAPSTGRAVLIEKIVDAARKPQPDIAEIRESKGTDGKWYGIGGYPIGVTSVEPHEMRTVGFAARSETGTTVGNRYPTRDALLEAWRAREERTAAEFRKHLEEEPDKRLASQAMYWLKGDADAALRALSSGEEPPAATTIPATFQTKTNRYVRKANGDIDIYKLSKDGKRSVYETTVEPTSYAVPREYRLQLGTAKPLEPATPKEQLTEGARAAGAKKLKDIERRYGVQSTRHTSNVRSAETPEELAAALAAAETEGKAHQAKNDEIERQDKANLAEGQRKAIAKGRALVAAGKQIVWRVHGFGRGHEIWEPMESAGAVKVAGTPAGTTFSAYKDPTQPPAERWVVIEDETGRSMGKAGRTKAETIAKAEEVIRNLKPGQWDAAMAKAKKSMPPKPDLSVDEVATKYGGEKVANPESRYAGDKLKDLLPQVEEEQRGRFEAMLRLEEALETEKSQKKIDALTKELGELRDVYQGTYSEVEDAAGADVMNRLQDDVEEGRVSLADEILNPPKRKGEPANEEERLKAREAAAAKKTPRPRLTIGTNTYELQADGHHVDVLSPTAKSGVLARSATIDLLHYSRETAGGNLKQVYDKWGEAAKRRAAKTPPPGITPDQMTDAELKALGTDEAKTELANRAEKELTTRSTSLPTRAFDVLARALERSGIRDPFPQGAVEFRTWMAEQLDVPVTELTENIDVINDAAEAALAAHLRKEADSESLELALNQAINYEDLLPRAHRTLEKSKLQQFSTPLPIGLMAGHAADLRDGDRVLEPTAGTGSLLVGVPDDIPVTAVELSARRADLLRAAGLTVLQGDYLTSRQNTPTVIIANPPWGKYSTGKYGKGVAIGFGPTDVAERFVGKMLRDLAPGGRLVAVMPTTMVNAASFKAWLRHNYSVRAMIQAPPGAYDTRSTGVDSILLVVDNQKPEGYADGGSLVAPLPKTVVTADWTAYREAVEAIPERTHEPTALAPGRRPGAPGGAAAGPRAGGLPGAESAGGRPARPKPGRNTAVEPGRPPDVVAEGGEPRGAAPKPTGEFTQRLSGPSADARAKAQRSESFAPYPRRTALRGLGHPKLVVEARQLAGVDYPPLTIEPGNAVREALAGGRVSVEQAEQSMAAVQANVIAHHGYLAADAVGVGKSREIALTILEAMERAQQAGREFRLVVTTKSSDNIADLIDREMYYVARGRTKDGTDLANPGAPKVPPQGLPFQVEMVTDRKNAKKFGTKEYEPLPVHKHGIYVIDSFNLAAYESALEEVGAHGVVGDEAHRFKNIEGAAVGGAWQRLHALIIRDVPRPEQFFAYFTATPAQAVEDYAYLYGLRLWPVDGFGRWLDLVTGSLSEAEAQKLQEATDKGAIDITRVTGNAGGDVVGGDGENETGAKKKGGGITNRSAFDARLTPTEGEQIPREWKMLGRFSARDLWRDGTEFSIHEAKLSEAHQRKYDQFVDLAQDIIETAAKYGTADKSGKASRFGVTGLLQFAAKRIQMQPAIEEAIKLAQKEVATGHQVVLSLINVSEMNDERGHLTAAIDKINTRIVDTDPDDPDGGFQDLGEIPEALVDQARLRDRVRDLGTFDDPLKLVEDAVGKENVAFIVGGTGATRQGQVADFQAGKRDYAVLSAAGSTGINLDHRILTNKLPARGRRVFIDVQYEWSATESLQRYGRVDRASSITPPKIYALTFGSAAEKKFLATIANRMAALGALSKGGAESTGGASALEEFEITGDDALAAARKAYEELDRDGKRQFARIKSVFRDPNRETRPDRSGYDPYAPKPSGSGTVMQDFQLPLLFMPLKESNAFWKRFIELRDEFREKSGLARATRTERFKGDILNTAQLKPNLTLYSVKNEANQKFGILTGLVTQELPKIRQALKGGDYNQETGRYESSFTRRYVTFTAGDQTVTGLQIKWTNVPEVAALYDHHLQGDVLDTPEKVRQALLNGEKIPLQEKNPDSGKPWTLRYRSDQKIVIDHARMADRALLLRYGADFSPVGNFWYVKDLAKFLERFPIAERSTAPPPKKPSSGGAPSSSGGTTLQATIVPGGAEFFEQDVLPGLKSAGDAFVQAAKQLQQAVAPATIGAGAKAAGSLRAMMARETQENARMAAAALPFQQQFDRLLATPGGRDQAIDWWDAVQTGQPTKILPELKAAAVYMRGALDDERIEIQKYGKLEEFNEFYFPQIWKFPKQEAAWVRRKIAGLMGKRPFEGSKSFLKQRKYPTFREGLDALLPKGVEPISYNPVDHFLIKLREMRRYRVARAAIKDYEQMGIWKGFRGAGVKPPEGWSRIEGPLGTIYGRPEVGFKEAFDPDLFEGLERFARSLGVRLERKPQIGGKRWGYAQGDRFIMTKAAGPEGVLMHELGHILDERYGLRGMVNDKKFREELRALADLRHEGTEKQNVRPGFRRYIRKGEEKIANLVHAFLYAPERAKKIAPNAYWALYNLAKKHAELRPLLKLQKTRSLKLGTRTHFIPVGGFPEIGFYAMPDDAARVFNNHLSRGLSGQSAIYDAYRWLNNTMVTGQLAASGLFHVTFTGLNALVSEGALALQELTLAAQTGDWKLAGTGAARLATAGALGTAGAAAGFALGGPAGLLWATGYPLAGLKWIKGWRAQKEWLTKDPAGRFFADHVRQMNEGGFRPTWDSFYDNGAMKNAIRALKQGNYPGALLRTIPAALDAMNTPVMRWLVPGVKTAAYLDAAGFELARLAHHVAGVEDAERELANLPQSPRERAALSPEEKRVIAALEAQRADNLAVIREALNKVQASIDNRFGEVVYDNWFWKRWLKDLTHVTFRSPGWQFGTYKEFGGALTSQAGILAGRARGGGRGGPDPEALLSGQMAWLLALVGMTMLMGGMAHYLATGERPQGRDWIFPKGPDGKRRAIPTYLRTIMAAYLHPVKTVGSITAPLNTMLYRLLISNETYSGEVIREPGDPFLKQAWDALRLVASEGYQPFVSTNIARGEGKLESVMGVAPAAAELQRSAAENYLHDVLPPSPARTHDEQQKVEARRDFRGAVRGGKSAEAAAAAQRGGLSRASIMTNVKRAQRDSLSGAFEAATLPQALHAYELAEPEERTELKPLLARKWHSLFKNIAPAEKAATAAQFSAAMKLPTAARPAAAAAR